MNLARVIGTIWASRKNAELEGAKVQLIQPISAELVPFGKPLAAIDTVGAGEGEIVFYVTAYEAVIPYFRVEGHDVAGRPLVPIDASLVGIVDSIDHDEAALGLLRTQRAARPAKGVSGGSR